MSDRIFAGIWLLLCIAGLFIAWQIQSEYSYEPVGPRPFPLGIIGLMALCALALLLRHPDTVSWPRRHVLQKLITMIIILLMYAWDSNGWVFPSPPRFSPWLSGCCSAPRFRRRVSPARYWAFCCGMPLTGCLMSPYLSAPG